MNNNTLQPKATNKGMTKIPATSTAKVTSRTNTFSFFRIAFMIKGLGLFNKAKWNIVTSEHSTTRANRGLGTLDSYQFEFTTS